MDQPKHFMLMSTREYIEKRAQESNITADKLGLDPDFNDHGDPLVPETVMPVFQITGIFDGALDVEFYVQGMYEVNIADWIGELYQLQRDEGQSWDVHVYEYAYEDAGPIVYKLTDETFGG